MSTIHSTSLKSNFSLFNSISLKDSKTPSHNVVFLWPKGLSYSAWKNLSRSQLHFLGKTARNRTKLSHRSKKVKEGREKERIQIRMRSISCDLEINKPILMRVEKWGKLDLNLRPAGYESVSNPQTTTYFI